MTIVDRAAETLEAIRAGAPRIHCITNDAAKVLSANMLLAIGATPSLTSARDEVGDFVRSADALLVNLGTLDDHRVEAVDLAIETAARSGVPWLLDPVFCNRSTKRLSLACALARRSPAVIRANGPEVDSMSARLKASDPGAMARALGAVVVVSGARDEVTDGQDSIFVDNGHELMSRSTAIGCAGTAVMAAFAACGANARESAAGAMVVMGVAGEIAGEGAAGPGSFVPLLIDALYGLTGDRITEKARVS